MPPPWTAGDAGSEDVESSSFCISSPCSPFFSRKATFFSRGASRTDASSRNVFACSTVVLRSCAVISPPASFEVFGEESDPSSGRLVCQAGMDGFLESGRSVMLCLQCVEVVLSIAVVDAKVCHGLCLGSKHAIGLSAKWLAD